MGNYLKAFSYLIVFVFTASLSSAQSSNNFTVTAYYFGGPERVDSIAAEKLTHIIFSFCHLKGNTLQVDNSRDAATITNLVALKKRNPSLKVLLSLGGWGAICLAVKQVFQF